ncbi:MAG TPA: type II secretion protein ATPase [Alphaproteobacteria bacterium]|nr:type II secretion protein ATPase [Alphaproteobacteria bacterium]
MSDDITSILLPNARIVVFALDAGTSATAKKLADDWRFARVEVEIVDGGMEAAIERYSAAASPELILIETNDISENFTAQLEALAGVCAEGTDAVVIGPTNDVHLYRSLVGMGVRDYLVRPISDEDLVAVVAKSLVEKRGLSGSRLVAVMGAKGGVGTSVMAQSLAWLVAENLGQKTLLLDGAGARGTTGVAFGIEPSIGFGEAVRVGQSGSEDDLKRIIQSATDHLFMMVFGNEPLLADSPDADNVEALLDRVMKTYPVVVMDLSGASPAVQKRIMARAAEVIIVSTPHLTALRNGRALVNEVKHLRNGLTAVDFIINKQSMPAVDEVPVADIKNLLGIEPAARIAYAPKIFMSAEMTGKPVGSTKSEVLKDLLPLAKKAAGLAGASAAKKDDGFSLRKLLGKGK